MNEFSAYESIAKAVEDFRLQNMTLLEEASKTARQAYAPSLAEAIASLRVDFLRTAGVESTISELGKLMNSPAVELARSANLSISRMLKTVGPLDDIVEQMAQVSEVWKRQLDPLRDVLDSITISQAAMASHLARISELSILAQASLSKFSWAEIGNAMSLPASLEAVLEKSFLDFSDSYYGLVCSFETSPLGVLSFPPIVSELPALEFLHGAHLLEVISVKGVEREVEEEKRRVLEETSSETEDALQTLLADVDAGLIRLWEGAKQALYSTNPDRVRHFTTSLRELFTHVLHQLAPDDDVRAWTKSPEHFDAGRPTRKARLLFIYRDINHEPLCRFTEKDIEVALEFLNLFSRGVHQLAVPYTEAQLTALKARMECVVRFMLEITRLRR